MCLYSRSVVTSPGSHPGSHNVSLVAFKSLINSHMLPISANLCKYDAPKSTCAIFISWIPACITQHPMGTMDLLHCPAHIALSYHYHHVHHNMHYIMLPHLNENERRFQTVHLSYARHAIFLLASPIAVAISIVCVK